MGYFFSNELFNEKSQKDLSLILIESLKENEYNLLPLNIGIENSDVNSLINLYNNKIRQREQSKRTKQTDHYHQYQ